MASPVDVPGEVEAGTGGDLAEEGELGDEGKLADLAMLELDIAEAVNGLLVDPAEEAEGVVDPEGGLGAELALKGQGEGSGGGDKGGKEGELYHGEIGVRL